jgi:hypothetical protein
MQGGFVARAAWCWALGFALAGTGWAADKDKAKKDYRIVSAKCNLDTRETSESGMGLTACRYVCEDPDKTKVSRVFMSATAVCAKSVEEKVKQLIR